VGVPCEGSPRGSCAKAMNGGHVWIVGAGPGDPGLLTLAGQRALAAADVVIYDALAPAALLRHAPRGAELVYVGKRSGAHLRRQDEIEMLMVERARAGKRVVRLKGGDPFVFGRGAEEALACRAADVPFTVVPGVTSAIGALAYAGIPVTYRGMATSFLVVPGNEADEGGASVDWSLAAQAETLVILMGMRTLEENMRCLLDAGCPPGRPVTCVRWGTRADQEVLTGTVGTIAALAAEHGLESPAVIVVGEVATLAADLAWFEPGPLAGRRVVVSRTREEESDLARRLESLGAYVVEAPVIVTRNRPENVDTHCVEGCWDWLVLASPNAVDAFFAALRTAGLDTRALHGVSIAAVGAATEAVLQQHGVRADFVPSRATSEALAEELPRTTGARVFLPVSNLSDSRLSDALRKRGAKVQQVAAYEIVAEPLDEQRLREIREADLVTFASATAARFLRAALGDRDLPPSARLVSIGEQTSKVVVECFGRVDHQVDDPSLDAVVTSLQECLARAP